MSSAGRDADIQKREDTLQWLECYANCGVDAKPDPFDCEFVADCLFDKCAKLERELRELKKGLNT